MRSSKSRSRSKPNRPRTMGNIVNRVFDSSGPEGKVRGTPQQIIDKYLLLARDAQLSNDRVAAENFLQHAEHYTRTLAEAQREMQREADERGPSQQNRNEGRDDGRDAQQGGGQTQQGNRDEPRSEYRGDRRQGGADDRDQNRGEGRVDSRVDSRDESRGDSRHDNRSGNRGDGGPRRQRDPEPVSTTDVIDLSEGSDSVLVETPEARQAPVQQADRDVTAASTPDDTAEVAEAVRPKPRRRAPARKPKPKAEGEAQNGGDDAPPKASAAE